MTAETACEQLFVDLPRYIDAGQATRARDLFTDDAVLELAGQRHVGVDAICRFLEEREANRNRHTRHLASNFRLSEVSDSSAHATGSLAVYVATDDGPPALEVIADCDVDFVRLPDGEWRMSRRRHRRFTGAR
jgi:ketosteroid isomerase-like protein